MEYDDLLPIATFVPERMVFPNSWSGHLPFAFWLMNTLRPAQFVELGTYTGNSYLGFCQAVKMSGSTTCCFAVDTWKGDEHASYYGEEVYEELCSIHTPRYASFSTLIRATFDEALEHFADRSVNLLHIDGLHTYDAVKHDFESWLPKLASGAIVLFHDISVHECGFGVWQLWNELCVRYPYHLAFNHSNGLGVLLINDTLPESLDWLMPDTEQQNRIYNYFTGLGESMLERYRAIEQEQLANFHLSECEKINHHREKLELHLEELKSHIYHLQSDSGQLQSDIDQLQSHIEQLELKIRMYRKLLAPIIFFRYLINGNFNMAINMLKSLVSSMTRWFSPNRT